jgi:hypothetical protein
VELAEEGLLEVEGLRFRTHELAIACGKDRKWTIVPQ